MHRTRVKICGVTRPEDAIAAAEAGADEVGMILQSGLARSISIAEALIISKALPKKVYPVGLFVDAEVDVIIRACKEIQLNYVQLHGHESWETVKQLNPIQVIKVIHVNRATFKKELDQIPENILFGNLLSYLLDTAGGGGQGIANDWKLIQEHIAAGHLNGILDNWTAAGGLTPENVGQVVRQLRPRRVDVSSGVEVSKREKSPKLIREFIRAVRDADDDLNRAEKANG